MKAANNAVEATGYRRLTADVGEPDFGANLIY